MVLMNTSWINEQIACQPSLYSLCGIYYIEDHIQHKDKEYVKGLAGVSHIIGTQYLVTKRRNGPLLKRANSLIGEQNPLISGNLW